MVVRKRAGSGYVLLDALAALALLTTGILMTLAFFRIEVMQTRVHQERRAAALLAESEIERLRAGSFESLIVGERQPIALTLPSAERLRNCRAEVTVRETTPGAREATVRVAWDPPRGASRFIEMSALLVREAHTP